MKFKDSWLMYLALLLLLLGCILMYYELQLCKDPIGNIIKPHLENKGVTEFDSIKVKVYQNDLEIYSMDLFNEVKFAEPEYEEINFTNLILKNNSEER